MGQRLGTCVLLDGAGYHGGIGKCVTQCTVGHADIVGLVDAQLLDGSVYQGECFILSLGRENLKREGFFLGKNL